ncbi:hypothetical protein PtB15_14B457 [Puccinia triticina]|nr:hypothetical protein PtB15_14B457 [Puccinia triticina]
MQHLPGIVDPAWADGYHAAAYSPSSTEASREMSRYDLPQLEIDRRAHIWAQMGGSDSVSHHASKEDKFRDTKMINKIRDQLIDDQLELGRLGLPDSHPANNMKPAFGRLHDFYDAKLGPLVGKDLDEGLHMFDAELARKQEGADHLETLRGILDTERDGESLRNAEFILVRDALYALHLLYKHQLITVEQVRDFFKADGIIKSLGRHLVDCYGEHYPHFSNFKNFLPDMDFLKADSKSVELHWWLNLIDRTTRGKILLRSMQKLFANMAPQRVVGEDISSVKWGVFLDEGFYQTFEWKGSTINPHGNQLDRLKEYVITISEATSTTNSLEEVLSNFWIRNVIFKYNANHIPRSLSKSRPGEPGARIMRQHELAKKILQIHVARNRFFEHEWWFDSTSPIIHLQSKKWIGRVEQKKHKAPEEYNQLKAQCQVLLETSASDQELGRCGMGFVVQGLSDANTIRNGWLNQITTHTRPSLTDNSPSKRDKLKGKLDTLRGHYGDKVARVRARVTGAKEK